MLAIKSSPAIADNTCTPNLLPCHIHHDGPVDASKRYWDPRRGGDGKLESYFRGRRLRGREVRVPQGYEGKVVKEAPNGPVGGGDEEEQRRKDSGARGEGEGGGGGEDDDEEEEEAKVLGDVASFEELVIWGHEAMPEADDPFVKGVEEWVKFAEAMHGYGGPEMVGEKVNGKGQV